MNANPSITLPKKSKGWFGKKVKRTVAVVKKAISDYKSLKEANRISEYFSNYFVPVVAKTENELRGAHKIRHDVFCSELKLFDATSQDYERDSYDDYSEQCLIKQDSTDVYAGTVRLIMPTNDEQILPIEKVALKHITDSRYLPSNFKRDEVCEISRIAIPRAFRRRKTDQFQGAATAAINEGTYSEKELRCFPLIVVGLYMTTAALAIKSGKKHAFFMVEPRLARSMKYIGIKLIKIGDEFEYVGRRAPYYINHDEFIEHLSPSFKIMMKSFIKKMA